MNIVRFYNQNRKQIWMGILIIASFIIVLQVLNYYASISNEEQLANATLNNTSELEVSSNSTSKAVSNTSGVTGSTISEDELESVQELFDEFYGYCNDKDLESAYDLLTDECKELIYPSIELFEENYYDVVFEGETKIFSFENWIGDTYIVTVEDDALATGKVSASTDKKVDYVTIVDDKLNISTFIGRTEINVETTKNDISVVVNSKDVYMNYETYNITVTNNTSNTLCLANVKDSLNIYLVDQNDIKYGVYNHELMQSSMILSSKHSVELSLKFYSSYVSSKEIEYLVFDEMFLNYESDDNWGDDTTSFYVQVE